MLEQKRAPPEPTEQTSLGRYVTGKCRQDSDRGVKKGTEVIPLTIYSALEPDSTASQAMKAG